MNAGFFVRLAAYLIDSLIVGAALLVVRIPSVIGSWSNPNGFLVKDFVFQYSIMDITCYLLTAAYFVLLTYHTGSTVGKKLLHLRVVSTEERDLTFFEVAFRETVGRFLSALVVNVGYFMIGIHKEKLGLHDMLSDTKVIYYHEKKVEVETPIVAKEVASAAYNPAGYGLPVYVEKPLVEETAVEEAVVEESVMEEATVKETEMEETAVEEAVMEDVATEEIEQKELVLEVTTVEEI